MYSKAKKFWLFLIWKNDLNTNLKLLDLRMKHLISSLVMFSVLLSCVEQSGRTENIIHLEGTSKSLGDVSVFTIEYASDSLIIAESFSKSHKLSAFSYADSLVQHDFLRVGNGPREVHYSKVKYVDDTLHVQSHTPYGMKGIIRIPLHSLHDESQWAVADYMGSETFSPGYDFDLFHDGGYVMLGGSSDDETICSYMERSCAYFRSLNIWPSDTYDGPPLPKRNIYTKSSFLFCNDTRIFYGCGEGRYASVWDLSSSFAKETVMYSDYPEYKSSQDGLNPKRLSGNKSGIYAYATDTYIYLTPIECRVENGKYVPDNYKGYPPYYNDEIDVFDWEGQYKFSYIVDVPFCSMFVNEDEQCLYTLSRDNKNLSSVVYRYNLNQNN